MLFKHLIIKLSWNLTEARIFTYPGEPSTTQVNPFPLPSLPAYSFYLTHTLLKRKTTSVPKEICIQYLVYAHFHSLIQVKWLQKNQGKWLWKAGKWTHYVHILKPGNCDLGDLTCIEEFKTADRIKFAN